MEANMAATIVASPHGLSLNEQFVAAPGEFVSSRLF